MRKIIVLVLLWLITVNLFAVFALNRLNLNPDTAYLWIDSAKVFQEKTWDIVSIHARWDSFWYLDIVANGYNYIPGELSNIVFFPLYPMLIKLVSVFLFVNAAAAGWIISILALFGGATVFYKFIKIFHPDVPAVDAVLFLLIFPTAFFFNMIYSESLFLLLSVSVFYFLLKKDYWKVGLLGMAASLTRVTGVLLFIPALYEYIRQNGWKVKKELAGILMMPAGALGFVLFHWAKFGDPLLFFKVQSNWGRDFSPSTEHFFLFSEPAIVNFMFDLGFALFSFAAALYCFFRLRRSYGIYMIATLAVALGTGTLMSINRYVLVWSWSN